MLDKTPKVEDLRIVFMGTPYFAVGVLKKLVEANKNIVGVITAPDKPAGRGRKLMSSDVKKYAESKNLTILQPTNLKNEDFLKELKSLNANLQIIVAFRMLPKEVWAMPIFGTFNLHASLLPQYRGAAPINWVIINSETKTGVTTFFIDEKIDTGEIIAASEISIDEFETAGTLHDKLMEIGSELVLDTVSLIENGTLITKAQHTLVSLNDAPKLSPENTKIDWAQSAKNIEALIRGLSPYPVAWSLLENNGIIVKIKIFGAIIENENHHYINGTVLTTKKEMRIAVQNGYLNIKEIQLPGKRKMSIPELLNGYSFQKDAKVL